MLFPIRYPHEPYVGNSLLWSDHFEENLVHMGEVPWQDEDIITTAERQAIAKSIATFQ